MISEERRARLNERQFFGRRKGPALSPRQQDVMVRGYARYGIDLPEKSSAASSSKASDPGDQGAVALDLPALFPAGIKSFGLEIGFGKGEHLAHQARTRPEMGLIGCEPFLNGMAACLDVLLRDDITNVRVYMDDARAMIDALPDAGLDIVYLLHPDPWHKKRHAKRRFVNPDNLDALARVLKPGGELRIVTDDPVYRQWTAIRMTERTDFRWMAEKPADWRTPPADWIDTRYALKAEREGRFDCFFRYQKL
jgi:tRNA (guanine-N7-)-methyltransferase